MTKKLKHSKFKNSGILFELLARQITADLIKGNDRSAANTLIQKFFSESTALGRERKLYEYLLTEKTKYPEKAKSLLEMVIKSRKQISNKELCEQKFNLIKEIKKNYPVSDFLKTSISNYKEYASIYKLFEDATRTDLYTDPKEIYQAKHYLLEHISKKRIVESSPDKEDLMEVYRNLHKDERLLSFKLLVDGYTEKYSNLPSAQKGLLEQYILNVSNTNALSSYVYTQVDNIKNALYPYESSITDDVLKIKLKETVLQLDKIKTSKLIKDNHIMAILMSFELLKELSLVTNQENNLI